MKGQKALAYTCCIIRSIIYGSSILFTSNLLDTLPVMHMLALRFLISAVAFILLQLIGVIKIDFKNKPIKLLFMTALFEPVAYFIFESIGIAGTTTSVAGILAAATSIMVLIFESIFLKEKTTIVQKLLLMLSVCGVITVTVFSSGGGGENSILGIVFLLLANMSGALFIICSRKSSTTKFSAIEVTYFSAVVGAVVFNAINLVIMTKNGTVSTFFTPLFDIKNIIAFVFLSILSTILATLMNNFAISKIQASSVSALGALSTVVTIVVGVIFKGDKIGWYHIVGTALILCGSIGINYITQKRAALRNAD